MQISHRVLVVVLFCSVFVWLSGPVGRLCIVLPLLLFGPGYLVDRALRASDGHTIAQRLTVWLGFSLSLVALLYEWSSTFGLALTTPILSGLAIACGLAILWNVLRTPFNAPSLHNALRVFMPWSAALCVILALTLWVRFEHIKTLVVPPWVDSVHHALMIRVAAETGQMPVSLRPYLPVDQLPYHWGYHVFMAATMQLSGLDLVPTMLWAGQVLNALMALGAAALAQHYWRRPLAGVVAALFVGLISIMPAYYLSWGRYTQLTGLLLIPSLALMWRGALYQPSRGRFVGTALLLAGLSLIHFRILMFSLALFGSIGTVWLYRAGWDGLRRGAAIFASVFGSLALAGPWLWLLYKRTLQPAFSNPETLLAGGSYNALNEGLLWTSNNRLLFALALVAALWAIYRHRQAVSEILIWLVAIVLMANPNLLGLPHTWLITNDVLVISLFLPASLLLGGGACLLYDALERLPLVRVHPYVRTSLVLGALAVAAVWGAWNMRSVVNPNTVIASSADIAAVEWAAQHTPTDARFLINSTKWLTIQRGVDGGWWLQPLAKRWVSAPAVMYTYATPEFVQEIAALNQVIMQASAERLPDILALIDQYQISHIFLGNHPGTLTADMFADHPRFTTIYDQDGVIILAVER
jgi:hypothetical protein